MLTLSNVGGATLTITGSIAVTAGFAETDNCGSTVAAGSHCTINVTFNPTVSGSLTGTLSVIDNAAGSPHTVALSGTEVDFSIAPVPGSPTSSTVTPGQPASYELTLVGVQGFTGQASVTCTGAPSRATCVPNQSSVTLNGTNPANVTVNVTTTAASTGIAVPGANRYLPLRHPPGLLEAREWLAVLCALLGLSLLFSMRRYRLAQTSVAIALFLVLISSSLLLSSCGGGSGSGGGGNPGTPMGQYTLVVTATLTLNSETITHTQSLTLVVQ